MEKPSSGVCNGNMGYDIWAERSWNIGPGKPTLRVYRVLESLYVSIHPWGQYNLDCKSKVTVYVNQRAATFHLVSQFQAEMIGASVHFTADLKHGTKTTVIMLTDINFEINIWDLLHTSMHTMLSVFYSSLTLTTILWGWILLSYFTNKTNEKTLKPSRAEIQIQVNSGKTSSNISYVLTVRYPIFQQSELFGYLCGKQSIIFTQLYKQKHEGGRKRATSQSSNSGTFKY